MKKFHITIKDFKKVPIWLFWLIAALFLVLFIYPYYGIFSLSDKVGRLNSELASTTSALNTRSKELSLNLADLREKTIGLSDSLSATEQTLESTKQNVEVVQSKVGGVEQTVGQISGTVNTLQKLSKTDPELLQKYSKVYFLNEHYVPERLSQINKEFLYTESRPEQIHASALPYLNSLLAAAGNNSVKLYIKSAYRSFDEQESLKSSYTVVYGAGTANQFSADQGYSEHQLGTTVDFITTGLGGALYGFEKTTAYEWLLNNAYHFGFILSYPQGNSYYIFEPWHWRFVGVKLAGYLHDQNKSFYTLDQREIDTYLVNIFD